MAIIMMSLLATVFGILGIMPGVAVNAEETAETKLVAATANPTNVIKVVNEVNAAAWEASEVYAMTKTGTQNIAGRVQMLVSDKTLYVKMYVYDETKMFSDNPFVYVQLADTKSRLNGKYYDETNGDAGKIGWPNQSPAGFGQATVLNVTYAENIYTLNVAYNVGDLAKNGAHLTAWFGHGDQADETQGWADGLTGYASYLELAETTYYIGEYSENDTNVFEPIEQDPEPTPGPENTDLGIVVVDIARTPTEEDWKKATAYNLISVNGNSSGATGTIKILTAFNNIFYRLEINEPTLNITNDRIYIYLGYENEQEGIDQKFESRGNYDNWLNSISNDFGNPSLYEIKVSIGETKAWKEGAYVFEQGFHIKDLWGEGKKFHVVIKHCDSRNKNETWKDSNYFHTIYFDQVVTFGAKADTTVRPQTPTEGFTAGTENVSYNKVNVTWNEVEGADTYKMYVYKKNAEGEKEQYTNVSIEGPLYSGYDNYSESILGLSESTTYAVQVVAYDEDGEVIGYSSLEEFTTISREEADNSSSSTPSSDTAISGTDSGESGTNPPESEDAWCVGSMGIAGVGIALAVAAVAVLKKKEN